MSDLTWLDDDRLSVTPPKRPKKITGTRFATILGLNPWSTPFEVWCEVTRTYNKPFEDTIYTIAGKTIEPKQAEYMKKSYFMTDLVSPTDLYGPDYFKETYGDFFHSEPILGGMWDYLLYGKGATPSAVLEMKTTKRAEDWREDVPEYYALQAALYAYILGVDDVIMVASFLKPKDYADPASFQPCAANTKVIPFKISERYPHFDKYIQYATEWWKTHVVTGISPVYDEKKDAEVLKALRTNSLSPETDLAALVQEAETLKTKLDAHAAEVAADEKRYKTVTGMIKEAAKGRFRDGDKKVSIAGTAYTWEVSRTSSPKIDKEAMVADGVLDKYSYTEDTYKLLPKAVEKGA